jgi:hypothetical protein
MQCALYVLHAFPIRESGTEMPGNEVADYFFRRNIPASQCVVGLRHAVAMGWIQLLPGSRIRLLEAGVASVTSESIIEETPIYRFRQ